ncbi:MAG: AtpZ/AtpI family protein, partial [Pseudomonadota bacterium]
QNDAADPDRQTYFLSVHQWWLVVIMAGQNDQGDPSMEELQRRRGALEDKIAARNAKLDEEKQKDDRTSDASGWARGTKLASEFVAGIIVGAGLGWGLDWFFGTLPLFFIVFLMLGFGAGILNVLRVEGMGRPK